MSHVITASTPHVIQRFDKLNPSKGWQGVSYAPNVPETDRKLAVLMRWQGVGYRFRAIPAPQTKAA